jgi:hypothetical protein
VLQFPTPVSTVTRSTVFSLAAIRYTIHPVCAVGYTVLSGFVEVYCMTIAQRRNRLTTQFSELFSSLSDGWLCSYISQSIILPVSKCILLLPNQKPVTLHIACWFCSSAIFALPVVVFWTQAELVGGPAYKAGFSFITHKFFFKNTTNFLRIQCTCYINRGNYWLAEKLAASLVVLCCVQLDAGWFSR